MKKSHILIGVAVIAALSLLIVQTTAILKVASENSPKGGPLGSVGSRYIRVYNSSPSVTQPTYFTSSTASTSLITLTDMADVRFVTLNTSINSTTSPGANAFIKAQVSVKDSTGQCVDWFNAGDSYYYHVSTGGAALANLSLFSATSSGSVLLPSAGTGITSNFGSASTSVTNISPIGANCMRFVVSIGNTNAPADIWMQAVEHIDQSR